MLHLLLFLFLCTQLSAMEIERLTMKDTERTPLCTPQRLTMTETQEPLMVFDETRRYFDAESRIKMRNGAVKRCLRETVLTAMGIGCIGCVCGNALAGCVCACTQSSTGLAFCHLPGGIFFEFGTICGGGTALMGSISSGYVNAEETRELIKNDPEKIKWYAGLTITQTMIDAADTAKKIWFPKTVVQNLIDRQYLSRYPCDLAREIERHIMQPCYKSPSKRAFNVIRNRLVSSGIMRTLLANTFRADYKLPTDVIKYLFAYIDFSTLDQYTFLSEKELLYLLRNCTHYGAPDEHHPIVYDYAHTILLAQNGWLSLTRSEKYPIQCEMAYFERLTLPLASKKWYAITQGPTVYLPYFLNLAKYYKFEDDPAYNEQFIHPSSPEMSALLMERKKYIAPKIWALIEARNQHR